MGALCEFLPLPGNRVTLHAETDSFARLFPYYGDQMFPGRTYVVGAAA